MTFEVKKVLHMKEGTGETSYAKTSYIGRQILLLTESIKVEGIREFYCKQHPTSTLYIADLGCSSSELNSLSVVSKLIATVEKARRQLGQEPIDYQVLLNDLPGNDFNTMFKSLPSFDEMLKKQLRDDEFGHCFVNGVPGSFYGRLFPNNSLHFVHSSDSLHWLSQVPKGIENKVHIYIGRTSSKSVIKAYFDQFKSDFLMFLRCRSKEVVSGGIMILTIMGRNTNEPYCKDSCSVFDLLVPVLNDMVEEGFIEEEKLNTFNMPVYAPSPTELGLLVDEEGSFTLTNVDVSQVNWTGNYTGSTKVYDEYDFAKCIRSVLEPLFISHFGKSSIIEQVFERYRNRVRASMATEKNAFINVTLSLSKRS